MYSETLQVTDCNLHAAFKFIKDKLIMLTRGYIVYKPLKENKSCRCASSHSNFALDIKLSNSLSMVRVL